MIEKDGKWFYSARSIDDDRFPEKKDRIRMFVNENYEFHEFEEDGEKVVFSQGTSCFDVKGYIPPALLNMATANNIYKFEQ